MSEKQIREQGELARGVMVAERAEVHRKEKRSAGAGLVPGSAAWNAAVDADAARKRRELQRRLAQLQRNYGGRKRRAPAAAPTRTRATQTAARMPRTERERWAHTLRHAELLERATDDGRTHPRARRMLARCVAKGVYALTGQHVSTATVQSRAAATRRELVAEAAKRGM